VSDDRSGGQRPAARYRSTPKKSGWDIHRVAQPSYRAPL